VGSKVLLVEDDRFLQDNVKRLLEAEGYTVAGVTSGEEALSYLERDSADIVILDIGLPGIDGLMTCRRIRAKWLMPIIMLTARSDAVDKVVGLDVGADDYLTKPFEGTELVARVRAHLRRQQQYDELRADQTLLQVGEITIDFKQRSVLVRGEPAHLTNREFEIVRYLAKNLDRAVSRDLLFETVWGYELDFNTNSLDVYIYRIRKKIEVDPNNPQYLQTMRGFGYRLQDPAGSS